MERVPAYRALFAKHPELSGRQRQLEQRFGSVGDALGWNSQPIGQAFDRWIGAGHGSSSFHVADRQGGTEPMSFGTLLPRDMRWPPMGVYDPDYRQPRADFVKPALLSIDGTFYSVYGDCQVAEHIPVKTETGEKQLGAMCYAGNLLYAASEELPPAMQSCGVYRDRMIWVGDLEGHVVLYLAKERKYVRKVVTVAGAERLLIPRRNDTGSVFTFDARRKVFREHLVESPDSDPVVRRGRRELPGDVRQILFCDERSVVVCSEKEILVRDAPDADLRRQAVDIRPDEMIVEGVYLPQKREICLLIGRKVVPDNFNVLEVRKSWQDMRPIWLELEKR